MGSSGEAGVATVVAVPDELIGRGRLTASWSTGDPRIW